MYSIEVSLTVFFFTHDSAFKSYLYPDQIFVIWVSMCFSDML